MARIETSSICRLQFANMFANCCCVFHTRQLEFASFSFSCEGRLKFPYNLHNFVLKLWEKLGFDHLLKDVLISFMLN